MTTTDEITREQAVAAIPHLARAQDEKAIRESGPLRAILQAEREEVRVRRAALVMGLHWHGGPRIEAYEVLTALRMAQHLHGAA